MAGTAAQRQRAWAALMANMVVLPGLGTVLLGSRAGWLQAAMALGGLALSVAWLVEVARAWWRAGALPMLEVSELVRGLAGIGVFAAGWMWAAWSGWRAVRRASRARAT